MTDIAVAYGYKGREVQDALDVEALAREVLASQDIPSCSEVSISFVDDGAIRELNRLYRGLDKPTDVLSFECDGADDGFGSAPADGEAPFQLGDVVVAVDVAREQAPAYGLDFGEELSLLVTHGLLHLCGYDHLADDEAAAMEAREQELLESFWGRPFNRHGLDG